MAITLEQVEKLKARAGVSFEEARTALEASGGDLLEAMLWLERQGKTAAPAGGSYSTRPGAGSMGASLPAPRPAAGQTGGGTDGGWGRRLWDALVELFHRSLRNQFEVVRHNETLVSIPVLLLAVVVVAAFYVVVPLAVLGLFFGCRYHFSGADLGQECINNMMDSVTETAEDIKRNVKNNLGRN